MKVYEALAEAFVGEGTTDIFGLMGDGNMSWMAYLKAKHPKINIYDTRHEGPSLAAADGWARVTGEVAVCSVTCGPGVAQLSTSLLVASRARTPIVTFVGEAPENYELQMLDQRRFAEATESGYVHVVDPDNAYEAVRKAFNMARLESRPVMVGAKYDMQEQECDDPGEYKSSKTLMNGVQRMQPDPKAIAQAVEIIKASKKPVIIAGRGALTAGAKDAIAKLGDRIGALLSTSLLAKGLLGEKDYHAGIAGLFASLAVTELFAEADCVIGIGASLNTYTLESGYLFSDARFIQIDAQPQVIMGTGQPAECYIRADALAGTEALEAALAKENYKSTGFRTPEAKAAIASPIDAEKFDIDPGTVDPREAMAALDDVLPLDVGLVSGVGHFFSFVAMHMRRPRAPALTALQFGCIGQGLGTAIGAVVASKKPMVVVEGDSSILMHIQELDTVARYKLPLLICVMNNEALGSEYYKLEVHGHDKKFGTLPGPNLAKVAEGFGIPGRRVATVADLKAAAQEFVKNPGPMFIDLRVSRSVISVPYRRLFYGKTA